MLLAPRRGFKTPALRNAALPLAPRTPGDLNGGLAQLPASQATSAAPWLSSRTAGDLSGALAQLPAPQ